MKLMMRWKHRFDHTFELKINSTIRKVVSTFATGFLVVVSIGCTGALSTVSVFGLGVSLVQDKIPTERIIATMIRFNVFISSKNLS